jgi:hypothetical protein
MDVTKTSDNMALECASLLKRWYGFAGRLEASQIVVLGEKSTCRGHCARELFRAADREQIKMIDRQERSLLMIGKLFC